MYLRESNQLQKRRWGLDVLYHILVYPHSHTTDDDNDQDVKMEPMAPSCHPKKEHHDPFSVPKRSMVLFFDRRHYTNLIGRLVKFNGCWSYDFSCVSYFQIVVVRTVGLSIGWRWFIYRPNGFIFQQVGTNMRVSKTVPRGTVLLTISLFGWLEYCLLCPRSLQNSLSPHGALSSWLLNCNGHWRSI